MFALKVGTAKGEVQSSTRKEDTLLICPSPRFPDLSAVRASIPDYDRHSHAKQARL